MTRREPTRRHRSRAIGIAVVVFLGLFGAPGCQPLPEVGEPAPAASPPASKPEPPAVPVPAGKLNLFQNAIHTLHETTVETFIRIEELEGKYAVMSIDVNDALEVDSFTPVLDGRRLETLTDLRFREAAAEVMADYATLLHAVSAGDGREAVDAGAETLAASVGILQHAPVPDGIGPAEVAGIFDGVMADLDAVRAEADRRKVLTPLMTGAQVDLQRLSTLIIRDHGKLKTLVHQMIRGIIESANDRRPLREDSIDPALTAFDSRIASLVKESGEIRAALDDIMAGFAQVPEAHFAIRNLLGQELEGLPALQELVRKAQKVRRRYRALDADTLPLP